MMANEAWVMGYPDDLFVKREVTTLSSRFLAQLLYREKYKAILMQLLTAYLLPTISIVSAVFMLRTIFSLINVIRKFR